MIWKGKDNMRKKLRDIIHVSVITFVLMVFVGCSESSSSGDGGNGSDTNDPLQTKPNSSTWEEMIWDEDNWG